MTMTKYEFAAALRALGDAEVFVGDWTTASAMESLGAVEGAIRENITWTENKLTAPQHTGGVAHAITMVPDQVSFTVPIIAGDPDLWAKISPNGSSDGVADSPVAVTTTGVLLVPRSEIPDAGIACTGGVWTPTGGAFINSLFFPKAYAVPGEVPRPYDNGGKAIIEVTFNAMYYADGPAGKRVWVRGDPYAAGYTEFTL